MHTYLEVSQASILHNLKQFRRLIGQDKLLMPVVKSNAYGHGLVGVAKAIDKSKLADKICVVNSEEALILKKNNIRSPIFILSYWLLADIKKLLISGNNIEVAVYSLEQAKQLNILRKKIKIHIKVDTGTSRLGFVEQGFIENVKKIAALPYLRITGIFTHYANSEEDNNFTREQTAQLKEIKKKLNESGIKTVYHAACSAAVLSNQDNYFDGLRLGISLYGFWPSLHSKRMANEKFPWLKLKPALVWKAKILQIKKLAANSFIGYGCTYLTKKKMKIAVVPVGYYEGYDRKLSNSGEVFCRNKKCPIIGRVCMNLMMVDVSKIKNIKTGDAVELLGKNITAEEIAAKTDTINYEVISRINPLLPRVYR